MPDEVPLGGNGVRLLHELLRAVLAEERVAGRDGLAHGLHGLRLRDSDDPDGRGIAIRASRRVGDPRVHERESLGEAHDSPTVASASSTCGTGRPITVVSDPSMRSMSVTPCACAP